MSKPTLTCFPARGLAELVRLVLAEAGVDYQEHGFVVGATVTVADLALWYLLEQIRDNGFGGALERYPAMMAFAERIGSRPRIAAYLQSARRPPLVLLPT